jgi:DNA polymerase phi
MFSAEASNESEMRRQLFGEYIACMIRGVNIADKSQQSSWIEETGLPIIANIAYGKNSSYTPPISEKTRIRFRNCLMSVITHTLSDSEGFSYSCRLLLSFTPDAVPMDESIAKVKDDALSNMGKLLRKGKLENVEQKPLRQAMALLYSLVIIQLYNAEPDAVSVLQELKLCHDTLFKNNEAKHSNIDASEVLVELLLSFISKPSALLRKATQHVFPAFMGRVTAGGLKLMTDILDSSEGLRGQQELFDHESDYGERVDDTFDEDIDSDVEVVDMDGEEGYFNGHLEPSSEEGSESESDASESGPEEDDEDEALNTALAQVLGTRTLDQDAEDKESDSDADMTDSEMMALDSKLVEIFTQRKKIPNKRKEQKDAKETMVNFKSRVLDLLEIYIKNQAAHRLAFSLLLPLLRLIRTTKTKPLADKAFSIIQMFFKSFKATKRPDSSTLVSSSETTIPDHLELLKNIHLEVSKDPSHMFAKAASTASLLVASSLYHADKESVQEIATVYRDSQIRWVRGEVRIQTSFFVEWINWCQSLARL